MAERAFRVVVMPAFAMDTVCCSMTSWIAVLQGEKWMETGLIGKWMQCICIHI